MAAQELEFTVVRATYTVEHHPDLMESSVHMRLRLNGDTRLSSNDGELLEYEHWGVTVSSMDERTSQDDPRTFGSASRLHPKLISALIELPPLKFQSLVTAILSGTPLDEVRITVAGLHTRAEHLVWSNPNETPLDVVGFSCSFAARSNSA